MARVCLSPNPTSVTSLNGIGDLPVFFFVMDPTLGFLIDTPPGIFCDSLERASSEKVEEEKKNYVVNQTAHMPIRRMQLALHHKYKNGNLNFYFESGKKKIRNTK